MSKYIIAGISVDMEPKYETLKKQSEAYLVSDDTPADISISLTDEFLINKHKANPHLSLNDCEYIWYGFEFYRRLPALGGILLHSSCIAVDGCAYLFSAPSGTGKSTHTNLWKKKFGDNAVFINDDKPALRVSGNDVLACGTPFSGKTDLNCNMCVPLKGICILSRSETNRIAPADTKKALHKILNQTYRPTDPDTMICTMDIIGKIFERVPIYDLFCNMNDDAADTAYEYMVKNKR